MRLLLAGAALAWATPQDVRDYTFERYSSEFDKKYTEEEAALRRSILEANIQKITAHNEAYHQGHHGWYMALNHLADRTPEELKQLRSKSKTPPGAAPALQTLDLAALEALPPTIDWRRHGVLTPVKNQGQCGSCWAFAATQTIESAYAIATGRLIELSPQTFVDCVKNPQECGGTGGCEGAIAELAFNYTVEHGLPAASAMPYTARDGQCQGYSPAVKASGYVRLPSNDAGALAAALAHTGPVAVSVAAEQWSFYGGGVFDGCSGALGTDIDHAVQAVGYSPDYWVIRNSWGPSWGEGGFIRLSRKKDATMQVDKTPADGYSCKPYPKEIKVAGECGVLSDSSYPTGVGHAADFMRDLAGVMV